MNYIIVFLKKYIYVFLFLIFILHAVTLSQLIFFPFPEFFLLPYLTNSGLLPYKEIVDQHAPGLFFLPVNAGTLGLLNVEIARVWLIVITCTTSFLIFTSTKAVSKNSIVGLLACLIFYFWHSFWGGWTLWIDSFIALVLLPAFYLSYKIMEEKRADKYLKLVMILGAIFGLGLALKQTILPLAILTPIVLIFFLRDKRIIYSYLAGLLPFPIILVLYFASLGVFNDVFYWAGIFNATIYPQMSKKSPEYPGILHMIISYSPILFFPFIRKRVAALLLCLFTFWSLLPVIDRFDSNHFQPSLPFLSIGIALLISQYYKVKRLFVFFIVYFIIGTYFIYTDYKKHITNEVIIYNSNIIQIAEEVKLLTDPKEEIYVYGVNPLLYYLSDTLPSGRYFVFQMPWYLSVLEDDSVAVLEKNKPRLIVRDQNYNIDGELVSEFAPKLNKYINENYEVFKIVNNAEFMRMRQIP